MGYSLSVNSSNSSRMLTCFGFDSAIEGFEADLPADGFEPEFGFLMGVGWDAEFESDGTGFWGSDEVVLEVWRVFLESG